MTRWSTIAVPLGAVLIALGSLAGQPAADTGEVAIADGYALAVAEDGSIRVPAVDFRADWTVLGTWIVNDGEAVDGVTGAQGLHVTYTQPGVAEHYRRTGAFPDGAILVKELLGASTKVMTTGVVSHAGALEGWFVMVKDTEGRFADAPKAGLWGDGWGWGYFTPDSPAVSVTEDSAGECLGCHVPAQATDWVYVEGYSVLDGPAVSD